MEAVIKNGKVIVREKKSEDERIREELVEFINHYRHNTDLTSELAEWCHKAITWLEKQKEHISSTEETELNSIAFLEQLGYTCIPPSEQKPAECITGQSMDNLSCFKQYAATLAKDYGIGFTRNIDWHNFCAGIMLYFERINNAEWSEEDYHWEGLLQLLRDYQKTIDRQSNNMAYEDVESYITWLKSLPQRCPKSSKEQCNYVDLGLPSGLKWATCNIGASAPEEYGDYFAWGETAPYYTSGHSQDSPCSNWENNKTGYNWASYSLCNGSSSSLTKYNNSSSYGIVDNNTVLDPEDDAAAVNWGSTWRMPTDAEWTELRTECTWTWTTQGGKNGYKVTSKTNGNSIFLPAAGYRYNSALGSAGSGGYYWSSSLYTDYPSYAYGVYFCSDRYDWSSGNRYRGRSVRAVSE